MSPDDPRHGTNAGYVARCRQQCCVRAHALYVKRWRLYGKRRIDITGTRRRLEALQALGWSLAELSRMLGRERTYLRKILTYNQQIEPRTAMPIAELYERLCMTVAQDAPERSLGWNGSRARTRRAALARGYAPPLAWDDIDDPNEEPQGVGADRGAGDDESVVERILAGDWRLKATHAQRLAVIARWTAGGGSHKELERHTGWNVTRDRRLARQRQETAA